MADGFVGERLSKLRNRKGELFRICYYVMHARCVMHLGFDSNMILPSWRMCKYKFSALFDERRSQFIILSRFSHEPRNRFTKS